MYKLGDRIEIHDLDKGAWVLCTVDSIDDDVITALSDEPQSWGQGRKTLYAVLKDDWSVLTRKPKET